MGHNGHIDYPTLTKRSFTLGVVLFLVGLLGTVAGHALFGTLPAWEETLLFDAEVLGLLLALLSPFVFGILLPLTE